MEKRYTAKECCQILGIQYPSFQQYVRYWNISPVSIEGNIRFYDESAIDFIKCRRVVRPVRASKYSSWFKASEAMPRIDKAYSTIVGYPISELCIVREYFETRKVRFNYLLNRWVNEETHNPLTVTRWQYAQISETPKTIQA